MSFGWFCFIIIQSSLLTFFFSRRHVVQDPVKTEKVNRCVPSVRKIRLQVQSNCQRVQIAMLVKSLLVKLVKLRVKIAEPASMALLVPNVSRGNFEPLTILIQPRVIYVQLANILVKSEWQIACRAVVSLCPWLLK